jgi:CBS domain-containing protein
MDTSLKHLLEEKQIKGLLYVALDASVEECILLMNRYSVGAVLVVKGEKLVGIFTERDVLSKVIGKCEPRTTLVSEVMTDDPITVSPNMSVRQAMYLVTEKRFRHLPVVEQNKVLGLISSGDLTRWLVSQQEIEIRDLQNYITGDKY